jgi:hypothetical protein
LFAIVTRLTHTITNITHTHTHILTQTGACYVLLFLGAAPLIIALALLLQLLWLPLAAIALLVRASRNRRCHLGVLIYPLTAAAMFLDIDGE